MKFVLNVANLALSGSETPTAFYVGFDFDPQIPRDRIDAAGFESVEELTDAEIAERFNVRAFVKANRFQREQLGEIGIEV